MIQRLCQWILNIWGWKVKGSMPDIPRCVIIAAPHTSNWDFPLALLFAMVLKLRIKWIGKNTLFRFPFGSLMRALGGIGVDRSRSNNLVESVAELIKNSDRLAVVIPPEGTRSKAKRWKTGFYHIARTANVPIVCGFLDYRLKEGGIGMVFTPSGDIQADFKAIREFYTGIHGKNHDDTSEISLGEDER